MSIKLGRFPADGLTVQHPLPRLFVKGEEKGGKKYRFLSTTTGEINPIFEIGTVRVNTNWRITSLVVNYLALSYSMLSSEEETLFAFLVTLQYPSLILASGLSPTFRLPATKEGKKSESSGNQILSAAVNFNSPPVISAGQTVYAGLQWVPLSSQILNPPTGEGEGVFGLTAELGTLYTQYDRL